MVVRERYLFLVLVLLLVRLAYSQREQFAGNLEPDPPTNDAKPGQNQTEEVVHAIPASQEKVGSVNKAPRPLQKPESVGYIPPAEEVTKDEEQSIEQVTEKVVNLIPTLPPSIIKPGRMSNGSWYIVLYASWCEHSQAALADFLPTFQYIVDHNLTEIVVGKIDIIKHNEVAKHFRVKSIPTIFFFKNGVKYTFDHPEVTTTNLVNFMLEVLRATVSHVHSTSELAALKKNHSVIFLIVHDKEIDQDWQRIFMKQANDKALKAKFAVTTEPRIVEGHPIKALPAILVLKDGSAFNFRESLTSHALAKWILLEKDEALPTIVKSTLRKYLHPISGRRLAFLVVSEGSHKRTTRENQVIEDIRTFAESRKMHKKYQFGLIEGKSIPDMLLRSRRTIASLPCFFAFEPYTGYYYFFQPEKRGKLSKESVSEFLHDINSGEEERLGGVTFFDQVEHVYQLGYGIALSMFVHRPLLSMFTGLCMLGVICFYLVVCFQSHSNRPSATEVKLRKAARARRKREELAKREAEATRRRIEAKEMAISKLRDTVVLKKRKNLPNGRDDNEDSDATEESDSAVDEN